MGDNSDQIKRPGFLRDLLDRRFPQIVFIYMGVCWTILEFVSWIVEHYTISPYVTDLSFITLISMLPTVGMLAFFHGRPGRDQWTKTEKIGIPINIILTVIIIFYFLGGKELGSATTEINIVNESGKNISRQIPNTSQMKRLAIFFFENESADKTLDWLQYGLMAGCHYDLNQDPIFSVYSGYDNIIYQQISRADLGDNAGMPMSLEQKIAREIEREYFLDGSFTISNDTLIVNTWLYETNRGRLIAKHEFQNLNIFNIIDEINLQLKTDLDVPGWHIESVQDLPASEILTNSQAAYQYYITASNLINLKNDYLAAQEYLEKAISIDPAFAMAYLSLYHLYINLNKYEQAVSAINTAMQYIYKLPESVQFALKEEYYLISEEPEKRLAVIDMWVKLYPDDIRGRFRLADEYFKSFEIDKAISEYNKILKIDPARQYYLRYIGNAYLVKGDFRNALNYFNQYQKAFPKDYRAFVSFGDLYLTMGQYDKAQDYYTDALMLEPNDIYIHVVLAEIKLRTGNYSQALGQLRDTELLAKTPEEKQLVFIAFQEYFRERGMIKKAFEYMNKENAENRKFMQPMDVIIHQMNEQIFDLYPILGKKNEGLRHLQTCEKKIPTPWSRMLSLGYLQIFLETKDVDNIIMTIDKVAEALRIFDEGAKQNIVYNARGRLFEMQEDYLNAIIEYQKESCLLPTDATVLTRIARCYRMLDEYSKSKKLLEKTIAILPMCPEAHFELARIYFAEKDLDNARQHMEIVLGAWRDADVEFQPANDAREFFQILSTPT